MYEAGVVWGRGGWPWSSLRVREAQTDVSWRTCRDWRVEHEQWCLFYFLLVRLPSRWGPESELLVSCTVSSLGGGGSHCIAVCAIDASQSVGWKLQWQNIVSAFKWASLSVTPLSSILSQGRYNLSLFQRQRRTEVSSISDAEMTA